MKLQENRQTFRTNLLILFFAIFLFSLQSCAQKNEPNPEKKSKETAKKVVTPDYSQVDYSARSNIIKEPKKLKGDEKAIFYHPYFLKLTSKETKHLDPFKVKAEFAKLGIRTSENDRFVDAYSFFKIRYWGHKKSCEQWESFRDLAPKSSN